MDYICQGRDAMNSNIITQSIHIKKHVYACNSLTSLSSCPHITKIIINFYIFSNSCNNIPKLSLESTGITRNESGFNPSK